MFTTETSGRTGSGAPAAIPAPAAAALLALALLVGLAAIQPPAAPEPVYDPATAVTEWRGNSGHLPGAGDALR